MTMRINVTLDGKLLSEIKSTSEIGVSGYLARAAWEKLRRERAVKVLEEMRALPPAFPGIKNSVAWVRKLRQEGDRARRRKSGL